MMGMIGFTVGFIGFLLHNLIDLIEEPIMEKALGNVINREDYVSSCDFRTVNFRLYITHKVNGITYSFAYAFLEHSVS